VPPMLYVLVFLAAFLAAEGLALLLNEQITGHRAAARRRLRQIALGIQDPDVQSEDSILRARRRAGHSLSDLTGLMPGGLQLERRLYQAGLTISPGAFSMVCVALGVGAFALTWTALANPIAAFPSLFFGLTPLLYIGSLRDKRMGKFEEQFPEALDLITRALRAGHSLTASFQMVGEELPDPVGSEFAQVSEEIKLGQDVRVALSNLVYRIEAGDLPFFVTAITIQRKTGGNLAEVLAKLGSLIRERFVLYGKVRALTAVGRASANLLAFMPLALVFLLYSCGGQGGRSYVEPLYKTVPGHMLSAVALAMVLIGCIVSRRMARIEV
jgi:tight adherence protein B